MPGIKTSFAAVALQMAAAKEFGPDGYGKLDPITVGLPHPDAATALMSGSGGITAHVASPPFSHLELTSPKVHRVLNTMDVFGPLTILMSMTPKVFATANPRLMEAMLAATDEAVAFIAAHKPEAAATYISIMGGKTPASDIQKVLEDPESGFSTTPNGAMQYARFLAHAGTIKTVPAAWTDMFIAPLHGRAGN